MFKEQLELKLNDAMYKAANLYPVGSKEYDRTLEEALTSIINLVDKEVIGEAEIDFPENENNYWTYPKIRNRLRDDMRAIIRGNDE